MKYLSVCSGIEAATVAWHSLGWTPWAFAEVDAFPSAVLAHHYPHVPNLGDITQWETWPDGAIDILVGGTPCQSFSVAGKRGGMDDARGKLALSFSAIAGRYKPRYIVWENVPGVLSSSGGRDFGAFIQSLVELGYGVCWRVLDAQHVRTQRHPRAVPQRRRRVFVVGCLGSWQRAAAVLFVRESLQRDSTKGGKARESIARDVAPSLVSSGRGVERTGESRGQDPVVVCWWDGGQVSQTLDAVPAKGQTMPEKNRFPAVLVSQTYQLKPAWIPCPEECGDYWCNIHQQHTGDCDCPPIDEWETDPYGMQLEGPAALTSATVNLYGGNKRKDRPHGGFYAKIDEPTSKTSDSSSGLNPACNQGGTGVIAPAPIVLMDQGGSVMNTLQDGSVGTLRREMHGHEPVIAFSSNMSVPDTQSDLAPCLKLGGHGGGNPPAVVIPINSMTLNRPNQTDLRQCLGVGGNGDPQFTLSKAHSHAVAIGTDCYNGAVTGDVAATIGTPGSSVNASGPTVAVMRESGQGYWVKDSVAGTLRAEGENRPSRPSNVISQSMQVRRLTPEECEALQGFPRGYTQVPYRNKPAADGPRYKALGNSMAVNCMEWIGERIAAVESLESFQASDIITDGATV